VAFRAIFRWPARPPCATVEHMFEDEAVLTTEEYDADVPF
jgi:hypothetical protein